MADVKVQFLTTKGKQLAISFIGWRKKRKPCMTRKKFTVNAQSENSHGQERWGFASHKCAGGLYVTTPFGRGIYILHRLQVVTKQHRQYWYLYRWQYVSLLHRG